MPVFKSPYPVFATACLHGTDLGNLRTEPPVYSGTPTVPPVIISGTSAKTLAKEWALIVLRSRPSSVAQPLSPLATE